MKTLNLSLFLCLLLLSPLTPTLRAEDKEQAGSIEKSQAVIQMAILLDTSGSMDGLIEQAKTQLWKIVNEFINAKKDGKRPYLQVALYEYGKQSIPAAEDYLRMIVPFTDDLDKVSEALFVLKTDGGDEYCGRVLEAALNGLAWSTDPSALKVVFIAGNEPFTQGRVPYQSACEQAVKQSVFVNTIFCGNYQEGINTQWKDGADLGKGMYLHIDQNEQVQHIVAPQDAEITQLGVELNKTYIAYGASGKENQWRQEAQDEAALQNASSGASLQRAVCKSSYNYRNSSWDLVDASGEAEFKLEEVPVESLPEEMQKMSLEERKTYIEKKENERKGIQTKISELNQSRNQFIAEERKKMSSGGKQTLDEAMIQALRNQAKERGFLFED
jgi:hypothetical protein